LLDIIKVGVRTPVFLKAGKGELSLSVIKFHDKKWENSGRKCKKKEKWVKL